MADETTVKELKRKAQQLRYNVLDMIGVGVAGHWGGSSSLAEAMAVLYFHSMKLDPTNPRHPDRDRLLLSKGHAALIQYAALCEVGYVPREELKRVKELNGLLQGHPDLSIPGIEAVTGSLGQGLSIGVGMALAFRLDRKANRVYVIMGDGEQSEGQLWEAAMAAANFKVDNLTAFLDWNKIQATGRTEDIFNIPDLDQKWRAFGWEVIVTDGHDIGKIIAAIDQAQTVKGKPTLIILDTIKGKGVSFAENVATYHNGIFDAAKFDAAKQELAAQLENI
ncbi:transketolase [Propionivibrio dicarboxylicus]|uniref:Transketolase n=1 Tax=Propionivibrio dicarboxylicus TaxID=83767 RepID=A0A1G8N131_9RHOO|nr:transketolase [Propionivibrio dicarboxylicus]SDI73816.1 transketolase [Propionivibrio dicarboxylicus]